MNGKKYFGTDGIRGQFGIEPITPTTVLKLGWALGNVLIESNSSRSKVIIGKDTRVSGYLLESALEAGLSSAGVDISLLGPMPTPGIAYLTRTARAQAGIVISASHNSYQDNGIKIFSPDGEKLPDEIEMRIESFMDKPIKTVSSKELGKAERYQDAAGRYIEFCKSTIPHRLSLKGIKLIVDCANGAAYHIAPDVFLELGADVVALANRPDGFNINKECGSTNLEHLRQAVIENRADIGVALDGDGDRVILVDADGETVNGDEILYILGVSRQRANRLNGGIVGTLMTNYGLEKACRKLNIPFERTQVGDRYITNSLRQYGWSLGGETSGHIICLDKSTTGDGIIAALEVLHEMISTGQPLSELKSGLDIYPQHMVNVSINEHQDKPKFDVNNNIDVQKAVSEANDELADNGRIVLRPSGTEPVIRVMVEGDNSTMVAKLSNSIAKTVKSVTDSYYNS